LSHSSLRKEKDCLNCGTTVQGRYCHNCGQENLVPHDTFWHMVKHFVYDITHFDGNFFTTVRYLVTRPGFLSREYARGRRVTYLHPVKMYVFTSAMFFLIFFSFFSSGNVVRTNINDPVPAKEKAEYIRGLEGRLRKDTSNRLVIEKLAQARDSARPLLNKDLLRDEESDAHFINFTGRRFRNRAAYDSAQRTLPPGKRDGWLMKRLMKKEFDINEKFRDDPNGAFNKLSNVVLHRLPYLLFISLPLFAGLLKLVYVRRKEFLYSDHGVFTIHLYIFTFFMLLFFFLSNELDNLTGWPVWDYLSIGLVIGLLLYLYKSMRYFYGQGRGKTGLKFFLVTLFSIVMMLILFLIFIFFSAFTF